MINTDTEKYESHHDARIYKERSETESILHMNYDQGGKFRSIW